MVEHGRDRLAPARSGGRARSRGRRRSKRSYRAASWRSRSSPSPGQVEPSTTSRSGPRAGPGRAPARSSGSPGPPDRDREVVDQQRRDQRRQVPPGLAAGGQVDQLGARLGRVRPGEDAVRLDPRVEPGGPSGSADWTISVLDGCRPVRRLIISAARSPTSGSASDTTRFITDRPRGDEPGRLALAVDGQVRLGSDPGELLFGVVDARTPARARFSTSPIERTWETPSAGSARPGRRRLLDRAPVRPRRWCRPRSSLRSGATVGPPGPAGRRPPPGPRCRPRSWGSPAPASPPRRRSPGRRSTTPPRPRPPG